MAIYEFAQTGIRRLDDITFSSAGLHERRDLQRLLREHIEVVAPETLVISEEFREWEESQRRIDLLAIDKDANLVVIEAKTDRGWRTHGTTGYPLCCYGFHYDVRKGY